MLTFIYCILYNINVILLISPSCLFLFYRNLVLSTVSAAVVHVNAQSRSAQTIIKEHAEPLNAVACHPQHPLVAMGSYSGILKVWDFQHKVTVCSKIFQTDEQIHCITYDPQGTVSVCVCVMLL